MVLRAKWKSSGKNSNIEPKLYGNTRTCKMSGVLQSVGRRPPAWPMANASDLDPRSYGYARRAGALKFDIPCGGKIPEYSFRPMALAGRTHTLASPEASAPKGARKNRRLSRTLESCRGGGWVALTIREAQPLRRFPAAPRNRPHLTPPPPTLHQPKMAHPCTK